jgi:hypothetical protein
MNRFYFIDIQDGVMWLAGSDKKREGTFRWCYRTRSKKMKLPPPIPFAIGSPNNVGNKDCLALQLSPNQITLDDKQCDSVGYYICEVNLYFIIY